MGDGRLERTGPTHRKSSIGSAAATLTNLADCCRISYKDFLTLWKDADPDIPILKQAKAEYAKLQ